VLARLLLEQTRADVVIAGRDLDAAERLATVLDRDFPGGRISARRADAADPASLDAALRGISLVVVLITRPDLVLNVGRAALVAGCDYIDILVTETTVRDLGVLSMRAEDAGLVFVTQAGFHPGLPAVFIQRGAKHFDHYERADIAMAMNARFERPEQAAEVIDMVADFKADICRDGTWRKATYRDALKADMGGRFGTMQLFPIQMPEIVDMQRILDLRQTGVYVSGFNWFVDYLVFPMILIAQRIRKGFAVRPLTRLFAWGVNTFSSPWQGVVFANIAEGVKDGRHCRAHIVAEHDDAYLFTAIPIVACVKQYLDGRLRPGVWMMGHAVDADRLFEDMRSMGIAIREEIEVA
jgi:saccharopine dehydrogenase (NAD+, L-lysine-forming)